MWGLLLFLSLRSKTAYTSSCLHRFPCACRSQLAARAGLAGHFCILCRLAPNRCAVSCSPRFPCVAAASSPHEPGSLAVSVFFVVSLQTASTIRQPLKSLLLRLMQGSARKPASPLRTFYLASFHETQSRRTSSVLKAFPLKKTHRPKPVRFCSEANGWFRTGTSRRIEVDAKSRSRQSGSGCW